MANSFEERLRAAARSDIETVRQAAEHIIGSGGKRLRPCFAFLIGEALGVSAAAAQATGAAAELLHTGSLIHDDIIDRSELRRNQPSVHAKFGITNAVLTGDYLLARALQQLTDARLYAAAHEWARALLEVVEAEVLQVEQAYRADTTLAVSRRVAEGKTGALFAWCARALAMTAGLTQERIDIADRLGRQFGLAYQIGDDLLDFSVADTGKPKQKDLHEGQLTIPVQLARRSDLALDGAIRRAFAGQEQADYDAAYLHLVKSEARELGLAELRRCREGVVADAMALTNDGAFSTQLGVLLDIFLNPERM